MENEEIICRYCLSYEDKETLIYPCLCKTPVHRECLNEWLKMKYNDKQCEICLEEYKGINYNDYKNIKVRVMQHSHHKMNRYESCYKRNDCCH